MAKLFKHVGASLRAKTHDENDSAMRERGATGVFRNLAFQEEEDDVKASPSKAPITVKTKKGAPPSNTDTSSSLDVSPHSKDAPSTTMWASPPATPSPATKWLGSTPGQQSIATPTKSFLMGHRPSSAVKRAKNVPQVDEITAFDSDGGHAAHDSDDADGEGLAVAHAARGPSCSAPSCTTSSVRTWEEQVQRLVAAGRQEDAVRLVAPSDGMIRCTVRRVKNFLGNTLAYHMFLDSGEVFLLAARKRKKSKASNFVLSTSQEELSRESTHCIAKLRANFVGTEYALVGRIAGAAGFGTGGGSSDDDGSSGGGTSSGGAGRIAPPPEPFSREELAVHYKQTALKTKGGPRIMLVATPLPESAWAPCAADGSDTIASCLELARRRELSPRLERQLCMLATRPPEWDTALKAYTLDFHGRVRAASVKNFQLVHWDHNTDRKGSDLVLQYGKIEDGSDDFALDFTYPLSIQKAFAIALASTDSKLCTAL